MTTSDEYWMEQALVQAQKAYDRGEVPVGAVLVDADGQCLAANHNQPIEALDPSAHAEIMVIREAAQKLRNYRLIDSTLYVTLEPCVMCVGAIMHARIGKLVYGAKEPKTGAIESACKLLDTVRFNHSLEIESDILETECAQIISDFFAARRQLKKQLRNTARETE